MYKVQAMIDSCALSTLISTSLLHHMKLLRAVVQLTSLGFYGVGSNRYKYYGWLPKKAFEVV